MRKWHYVSVGLIAGVVLSVSTGVAAEEIKSLIGKQIEGEAPVVLDGKSLPVQAVIVDGTSYAPVRAVGEALGRKVDWEEGKVILSKPEQPIATQIPRHIIEGNIAALRAILINNEYLIKTQPDVYDNEEMRKEIEYRKNELKMWEDRLAELEAAETNQ